jgi:hypothetical protein
VSAALNLARARSVQDRIAAHAVVIPQADTPLPSSGEYMVQGNVEGDNNQYFIDNVGTKQS